MLKLVDLTVLGKKEFYTLRLVWFDSHFIMKIIHNIYKNKNNIQYLQYRRVWDVKYTPNVLSSSSLPGGKFSPSFPQCRIN